MSTLSGPATKGEKGKAKYQSLDINNLYRASRGESLETHQHKNTSSRRHGMQSLGKVPSARRAPANLPSLKSEYSGNDPAVSLVPTGGTGWGSKPGETGPAPTSTQAPTSTTVTVTSAPSTTAPATVSTPPTTSTTVAPTTVSSQSHGDKSWSSITSSNTESTPMFLVHQSPSFQQEFPSLSGDANTSGSGPKTDTSHLPGPSLRPQTEGSWMQGGSRPQGQMAAGAGNQQGTVPAPGPHLPQGLDVGGGRSSLGPSGVGVGPAGPLPPHHYRLLPQFMLRQNHPSGGFPPNYQHGPPRPRMPYPPESRFMPPSRGPSNVEAEEITTRPIIKEEDLKVMDEIARDTGWAAHDEIDYNQTLSFSDEEGALDENKSKKSSQADKKDADRSTEKESEKEERPNRESSRESMGPPQNEAREMSRAWQQPRNPDFRQGMPPPMMNFPSQTRVPNHLTVRQGEDEEVWHERRRIQTEEIAIVIERARQRKEEEEKRYAETRHNASIRLKKLEGRMNLKTGLDKDENRTSPNLNVQHGSNMLLPDWEKDKEKSRSRTSSEDKDEKPHKEHVDNFRNVQVDNRGSFGRDRERERDRDLRPERESSGQPFSRQFQNNLPPRFQRHAAERPAPYYRQNSRGSPQPPNDARWPVAQVPSHYAGSAAGNVKSHRNRNDSDISDRDRDENKENNRDRDRTMSDNAFDNRDRERFNRPPSRDSRERSYENNWKNSGYHEDTSRRMSESEPSHDFDNRQYERCQEPDDFIKEKAKDTRFYDEVRETDKKSNENFKASHLIQEDPFDERESIYDSKLEIDKRDVISKSEHRERPERPQRPDSRDSRASKDSRTSRDSIREDKLLEENPGNETSLSWADATYDVDQKEDKRKKDRDDREGRRESHMMYHQRCMVPGPITKEKLEASELKSDSSRNINLVPLIRNDKKVELKKSDNQWESGSSGDAWQRVSPLPTTPQVTESWADMTSPSQLNTSDQTTDVGQGEPTESQQSKDDTDNNKNAVKTSPERETETSSRPDAQRDRQMGRGSGSGRGMRHDSRGPRGWGNSYYRGGTAWRGGDRGRRSQQRRPNMGRPDWVHSESEASADEISASTESGKEDKRQDQERKQYPRSPKQGGKKNDKEERLRDSNRKTENEKDNYSMMNDNRRYEKKGMYDNNQSERGFYPRGEPSRRGRGGAPFRSKGSAAMGRRMDGYGPPTSKKPFTSDSASNVDEDKKTESSSQNQSLNKEDVLNKLSNDEKMKFNQQQLAQGIIGSSRLGSFKSQTSNMPPRLRKKSEGERRDRKSREISRRGPRGSVKSGSGSGGEVGDENWETTSEASEHEERENDPDEGRDNDSSRKNFTHSGSSRGRRHSQANRSSGRDKRSGSSYDRETRKSMVNGNVRGPNNKTSSNSRDQTDNKTSDDKKQSRPDNKNKRNTLDRIDLCNTASVVVIDDQPEVTVEEDQTVFAPDNNDFQEVRSKKNVKESNRHQKEEPQKGSKERNKSGKPQSPGPPTSKGSYSERPRAGKLPPRFAKLKETTRLQKFAQQHSHDFNELNKINQGVAVFPVKDLTSPAPPPPVNAWDKPITASLRTVSPPPTAPPSATPTTALPEACNIETNEHVQSAASSQRSSPSGDKTVGKFTREQTEKAVLDGTSPPVQTIIFENTNFKSAPVDVAMKSKYTNQINKNQRSDKSRERKIEEESVALGFKSPGPDMKLQDSKTDTIQMPISFNKNEDSADMKLDFRFDSDLTQLTDDKSNKTIASIQMNRTVQIVSSSQSSAADLQFKLASVKKVWENPPAMLEHGGEEHSGGSATSFTPTFGNSVDDSSTYGKTVDPGVGDDGTESVYNAGQQLQTNANTYNGPTVQNMIKPDPSSNVCKVKPQPQATMHPHTGPLSPPSGAFNSSPAQPGQHINYQPPAQYGGISAIPSPPTVFQQAELYQTFQLNNPQVIGSQGRSQFSQFPSAYLSQGLSQTSGFSQQSMYLHQTAPPPTAAPPDMFPTQLSQYRIQPPAYGTSQQLSNNPNTVLISSSSNSLMSATVKPSPPPIGAIGSKAASYQTPSQPPPSQVYIYPDPQLLNQSPFLQSSQLVQRPANNVVPTIPPSSGSYYSASTGGGAGAFYQPPGSSNMQATAQSLQTTFGMQAFNTQSPTPTGMGSFGSQLPRLFLQNPVPGPVGVGVVGSRVPPTVHRSNSPAQQPRTTTSSPRINKISHRQPSS